MTLNSEGKPVMETQKEIKKKAKKEDADWRNERKKVWEE